MSSTDTTTAPAVGGGTATPAPSALAGPPGVPFSRTVRAELRKMVDTRAGRWMVIVLAAAAAIILAAFIIWGPAEDASFRFPEAHWGTVGATQRLQRVIGRARAKELLFTGREMPATEALALGLVARLVPSDALAETGMETARQIAGAPALAMRLTMSSTDPAT